MQILKLLRALPGRLPVALLSGLLLAGCGDSDIGDLELWLNEQMQRPGQPVKPLRPIATAEVVDYPGALRDPFRDFYSSAASDGGVGGGSVEEYITLPPELEWELNTRKREELEQFELDALRMLGTMENSERRWALILDPQATLHRVEVDNYLGRNVGKIISIEENRVQIRELLVDPRGRLEERRASITLDDT